MDRDILRRPWTPTEDLQLRSLAPKISPERIGIRLKRTTGAIISRAIFLKIALLKKAKARRPRTQTSERPDVHPAGPPNA
jgi:hypothetical protein